MALIFYGGIAAGFVFPSHAGGGQSQILGPAFGSLLNLDWREVPSVIGLAAAVVVIVSMLYQQLAALAFDEGAARSVRVPTSVLMLALTVLMVPVVVGGDVSIGLLLISATMVIPVASAVQPRSCSSCFGLLCRDPRPAFCDTCPEDIDG